MTSVSGGIWGGLYFSFACWILWVGRLAWENRRHQRNLDAIPLRVHVNGTRGKSGVTRLIAAGLREGGYRTLAKVTGTAAKMIYPDGTEKIIARRGPANIREYLRLAEEAAECGAGALVAECMALQPELQAFCERRLMRSHVGVITNIRHDHEDIMGPDLKAIAATLGRTVPEEGKLVASAQAVTLLHESGRTNYNEESVRVVDPREVSDEEIAAFPFEVEKENVALALAVCALAGVKRETALAGMCGSRPDTGNLTVREYRFDGRVIRFIDAMAANDPDSTRILWNRYVGEHTAASGVLLHSRPDRRLRTRSLCELLAGLHSGPFYLTGDTAFAARCLQKKGISGESIRCVAVASLTDVLESASNPTLDAAAGSDPESRPAEILFAAGNRKGFVG